MGIFSEVGPKEQYRISHSYVFRFAKPDGTLLPVPADDKMHQFSKIITEDVEAYGMFIDIPAKEKTIEDGKIHSRGQLFGGERDDTNSYDNAMILRAINWASERFKLEGRKLFKTSHSPQKLSKASNGEEIR